ncbi:MAG: hypothetical protein LV481_16825 [Methylacidiphilales bacterium]|nr:hypothetical protein [Candidatus Methylacidiphilales bacterium]
MKSSAGRLGLLALLLAASLTSSLATQTATVTTSDPVSFAKGISRVMRPVQPDEVFTVIAVNGDLITIADVDGYQATLSRSVLKITNPLPSPTPVTNTAPTESPVTNVSPSAGLPATVISPNSPPSSQPPVSPVISPEDAGMIKKLNDAFQISLWANTNLWNEDVGAVAGRLNWPQESNTSFDASYRHYALGNQGVTILGTRAYSMALYARNGHPDYVSIMFVNKGDFGECEEINKKEHSHVPVSADEIEKATDDLNAAVKKDAETINTLLTALLGDPEIRVFGIAADNREDVHRWDWNGHAILLSCPHNEYAAIKIIPSDVADHYGDVNNLDRESIKEALAKRVLKRDNGDVVLQDIPMVDQGPKGYCVPATWERYLRYVDVPADMYVLAMFGNTGMGGGTNLTGMREGVNSYVESYHRRVETTDVPLDVDHLADFIDQGLPLMWGCYVIKDVEKKIHDHTFIDRKTVTDWDAYKAKLQADDKSLVPVSQADPDFAEHGHMRMIIGYNAQTDEFAISDSWGQRFAERWITVKEAQNISQNELDYVQW